jgi:hypothetical protein
MERSDQRKNRAGTGRGLPRTPSAAFTGSENGQAGPAVFAGNNPCILEMIPGGFVHNNTLCSARGAGVTDNISGPGAHDTGMKGLG